MLWRFRANGTRTAIEMSAGIISACLPTLRPAFEFFIRVLKIKGPLDGLFHTSAETTLVSKTGRSTTGGGASTLNATPTHGRKGSEAGFYRLSDENKSAESGNAADKNLRPNHGYGYSVTTESRGREAKGIDESDEIPLQGIRVHKDFSQQMT